MYWDWHKGRPRICPLALTDPALSLTTQGHISEVPTRITRVPPEQASRLLGVYLTPTGVFSHQLRLLKDEADTYSVCLSSPELTPHNVVTFQQTMYIPAMTYVLPALAIDEEELAPI